MSEIRDAGEKVLATREAEAWNVRATLVVGAGELRAAGPRPGPNASRTT